MDQIGPKLHIFPKRKNFDEFKCYFCLITMPNLSKIFHNNLRVVHEIQGYLNLGQFGSKLHSCNNCTLLHPIILHYLKKIGQIMMQDYIFSTILHPNCPKRRVFWKNWLLLFLSTYRAPSSHNFFNPWNRSCNITESHLEFECNFHFLQIPYFELQVTIYTWSTQLNLVNELPLQLGSRRNQSTALQSA